MTSTGPSLAWEGWPSRCRWSGGRRAAAGHGGDPGATGRMRWAQLLAAAGSWMDLRPGAAAAGARGGRAGDGPVAGAGAGPSPGPGPHRDWRWCWARSGRCCAGRGTGCRSRCRSVTSWPRPGWGCRGRSMSGTSPALLGDVTEPTAPFGLLDIRGDGASAARGPAGGGAGAGGAGAGAGAGAGGSARRRCFIWPGRGCWRRSRAVMTWCSARCCSGRMNAGAGADRVPGPFINTLPVRVDRRGGGGRGGGGDAGAAGRAAGARACAAGAGPAGQRRRRAGAAVHLDPELPAQPAGPGPGRPAAAWTASRCCSSGSGPTIR